MTRPTVKSGGTAMNSVCIRLPAEFPGYSRLRSSASRSDGGSAARGFPPVPSRQHLEQFDGVVAFKLAHALRDRFRFELVEISSRTVSSTSFRAEKSIGAGQFHQADAVFRVPATLDQIAEVGLVQFGHLGAQERGIAGLDRPGDRLDELTANLAIFVAHRKALEHRRFAGVDNIQMFSHGAPRRFDFSVQLV